MSLAKNGNAVNPRLGEFLKDLLDRGKLPPLKVLETSISVGRARMLSARGRMT